MLIVGLILGVFLGAVLSAALWATGRRPYLRVDVQQHTTREVVHHVVHHADVPESTSGPQAVEAAVVAGAVSAMPTVRPHPAVCREALTPPARKEIGR
ncbi:MAG: hypothetical protein GEU96_15275 [Propionibacteriales bacterium]|nr:hypothetical protein [Propionibacteriales bacterium]